MFPLEFTPPVLHLQRFRQAVRIPHSRSPHFCSLIFDDTSREAQAEYPFDFVRHGLKSPPRQPRYQRSLEQILSLRLNRLRPPPCRQIKLAVRSGLSSGACKFN
jgi:hypothetical protein